MRLIDADALLEALKDNGTYLLPDGADESEFIYYSEAVDLITNAPSVQREGWVSVPIESDEQMKDGARAFLTGLELGVKTFESMSEHLRLSGAYLPDWFLTSKGHINKMAKAHYIYESMLNASPTNTGVGNENILLSL